MDPSYLNCSKYLKCLGGSDNTLFIQTKWGFKNVSNKEHFTNKIGLFIDTLGFTRISFGQTSFQLQNVINFTDGKGFCCTLD